MEIPNSRLVSRNVVLGDGRTSTRLEPEVWEGLEEIARLENISISDLVSKASEIMPGNRASAARVFLFEYWREKARALPKAA